jgi:hypothetical protein
MEAISTDAPPACALHRGKRSYQTRTRALVVRARMYRDGGIVGRVEAYRCNGCRMWFLGRPVRRAVRERLQRRGRWL